MSGREQASHPGSRKDHTWKAITLHQCPDGTEVLIQEHSVASVQGRPGWEPVSNLRYHMIGTFDRATAEEIDIQLRQRFSRPGAALTAEQIEDIKRDCSGRGG